MFNTDPDNIQYIASAICDMSDPQRREELSAIKTASVTVHSLVVQELGRRGQAIKSEKTASATSPIRLATIVASQMMDYTRGDLRKLAMDIKAGVPRADEAFHFAYSYMTGLEV